MDSVLRQPEKTAGCVKDNVAPGLAKQSEYPGHIPFNGRS